MNELEKENRSLREELKMRIYDTIRLRSALEFYAQHCVEAVKSGGDPGKLAKDALAASRKRENSIWDGNMRNDPDYFSR